MKQFLLASAVCIAASILPMHTASAEAGQVLVNRNWDPDGAGPKGLNTCTFRYAADGSLMDIWRNTLSDYNETVIVYRPQDRRFYTSSWRTSTDLTYYDASAPAGGGAWDPTFTTWTPSTNVRGVAMTNPLLAGRDFKGGGCVDKDGNLYFVTPSSTKGVIKVTFAGGSPTTVTELIAKANMPDPASGKGYIAVDDEGSIYVSNPLTSTRLVSKYNPDGTLHTADFITDTPARAADKGIVCHGGFLYVATIPNQRIAKYNMDGTLVNATWVNTTDTSYKFTLATDGTYIYAGCQSGSGLYRWDLATATIQAINQQHGFAKERGLAVQSPAPVVVPKGTTILIR